jgi:hypothetical protein
MIDLAARIVSVDDFLHGLPDQFGGFKHGRRVQQVGVFGAAALFQQTDDALAGGEVAGRQNDQFPLARLFKNVHLAEGGNLVKAGIGARIGYEHQAFGQSHRYTIGHKRKPSGTDRTGSVYPVFHRKHVLLCSASRRLPITGFRLPE